MKNTLVEYLYRDAGNWKTHHSVVLPGHLTRSQQDDLAERLFIAEQIGFECLRSDTGQDDHIWHEVQEAWGTDAEPTLESPTAAEFYDYVINENWDERKAIVDGGFNLPEVDTLTERLNKANKDEWPSIVTTWLEEQA